MRIKKKLGLKTLYRSNQLIVVTQLLIHTLIWKLQIRII